MKLKDSIREQLATPRKVIAVGNPPVSDRVPPSPRTLYHKFIETAQKFADEILFVIPSRWFNGGKGLDKFRAATLTEGHVYQLRDFADARAVFPNVDISGGVCFLHWKKDYTGLCNWSNDQGNRMQRNLAEYDVFVRDEVSRSIVNKVLSCHAGEFLSDHGVGRGCSGISSNFKGFQASGVPIYTKGGKIKFVALDNVKNPHLLGNHLVAAAAAAHAGQANKDGRQVVISSTMKALPLGTGLSDTYLGFAFDSEVQAISVANLLRTRFCQALILARSNAGMNNKSFSWVPLLDFTQSWDDAKLAAHFNLTAEEVAYIESKIK